MGPTEAHRPATRWALVSLVCSMLGCLVAAALPIIYLGGLAVETTGVTAGVAAGQMGSLAGLLSLSGVTSGIVALRRSRGGAYSGRGTARVGVALGCVPFAALLVWTAPALGELVWGPQDYIINFDR